MAKKGMKKVDWRKSGASPIPGYYRPGEREKEMETLMEKIAPTQKEYRSLAAEKGERISPTWKPDDIGTKNFRESTGTAYLRKMSR